LKNTLQVYVIINLHETCHNPCLGFFQIHLFTFQNKKHQIKTGVLAKASWKNFTCRKNQAAILDGVDSLIVPHFTQNYRDNANSRSSYMIIRQNCTKPKPKDIFRFLIGPFNLIMGHFKV